MGADREDARIVAAGENPVVRGVDAKTGQEVELDAGAEPEVGVGVAGTALDGALREVDPGCDPRLDSERGIRNSDAETEADREVPELDGSGPRPLLAVAD